MFWSTETLRNELEQTLAQSEGRATFIDPYDPTRIQCGSYDLALGDQAAISGESTKRILKEGEQVSIPPGQFAHLVTAEVVMVPRDVIAFISIKTALKQSGLINVSGFHVDPGFFGKLVFSVYNVGVRSVSLSRDRPIFSIWFAKLDRKTQGYRGSFQAQLGISDDAVMALQGINATPPDIARRLESLEDRVTRWFSAARWIGVTVGGAVIALLVREGLKNRDQQPTVIAAPADTVAANHDSSGAAAKSDSVPPAKNGRGSRP